MAIPPQLLAMMASGIGNYVGAGGLNPGTATDAEKQYMAMLSKRKKEGMFNRGDRADMLQDIAMRSGGIASQAKQGIQNQMIGQGLEGSIIGSQAGLQADASRMQTLANANIGLNRSNKKYMLQAEDQLLGKKMELANRGRQAGIARRAGILGGIEDIAFQGWLDSRV